MLLVSGSVSNSKMIQMGVSKNTATPKWMVKIMENPITLPETNIAHENPIFLGKCHQNGGFSMAMWEC